MRKHTWWLIFPLIVLLGATPAVDVDELVRQGNAAFGREEYEAAVKLYEQAETLTTDPGLIAFNKAAAFYRLSRYAEAEAHYRCALEGATGPRRRRALYDLGNSLVKRSRGSDVQALQEAVGLYETCLREADADPDLAVDARDNLKVARVLLLQARQAAAAARKNDTEPKEQEPDHEDSRPSKPEKKPPEPGPGDNRPEPAKGSGSERTTETPDPKQQPIPTDERPQPGVGRQRVLEPAEQTPLAPQETEALLRRVWSRIDKQHRERRNAPAPTASHPAKNW
jgi:tetratricopeptide (TPR) repeat protein